MRIYIYSDECPRRSLSLLHQQSPPHQTATSQVIATLSTCPGVHYNLLNPGLHPLGYTDIPAYAIRRRVE